MSDRDGPGDLTARLIAEIGSRGLSVAVAESLTGGLLVAEFVRVPSASTVVLGGVVAYDTELKHTLLGVDAQLLAEHGPVHPEVAAQMAKGVREALAVGGRAAGIGISTTGVAGPGTQGGQPVGTVYIGISIGAQLHVFRLSLTGSRDAIRAAVVSGALARLAALLLPPTDHRPAGSGE